MARISESLDSLKSSPNSYYFTPTSTSDTEDLVERKRKTGFIVKVVEQFNESRQGLYCSVSEKKKFNEDYSFSSKSFDYQVLNEKKSNDVVLVVDGVALNSLLRANRVAFSSLSQRVHSIICCRVTPSQKAEVVKLVKSQLREEYIFISI